MYIFRPSSPKIDGNSFSIRRIAELAFFTLWGLSAGVVMCGYGIGWRGLESHRCGNCLGRDAAYFVFLVLVW